MSGQLPAGPGFTAIGMTATYKNLFSSTHDGVDSVREVGAPLWAFTASYPGLSEDEAKSIIAFLISQRGRFGSFTVIPPNLAIPRGVATGSPLVKGASQIGSSLDIDGATASVTGWLKAGDVITIAGDPKVYMQTVDVDSDVSGNVTLTLEPELRLSPTDNAVITVNNVAFTMRMTSDQYDWSIKNAMRYSLSLSLKEAL